LVHQTTPKNASGSLAGIIEPMDYQRFLKDHWSKKTCLIARDNPGHFSALFQASQVDDLLGHAMTNDNVQMDKGYELPATPGKSKWPAGEYYQALIAGSILRIQSAHLCCRSLGVFNASLAKDTGFAVETDVLVLPPRSEPKPIQQTAGESFLLQIQGETLWQTLGGDGEMETELVAGHSFYAPKGTSLRAIETGEKPSICLLVQIRAMSYLDLLKQAIAIHADKDLSFRKGLSLGMPLLREKACLLQPYFDENLWPELDRLAWDTAQTRLSSAAKSAMHPLPDGHFAQMAEVDGIGLDTRVERRPAMTGEMVSVENTLEFQFPGHLQTGPEKMFLAMDFFKSNPSFLVKDIPGWYNDDEKILCVRHLVRKGFLKITNRNG